MMRLLAVCVAGLCFAAAINESNSQPIDAVWGGDAVYPGYPGSFLVAPQQGDFTAPGIYRSIKAVKDVGHPLEVDQICQHDVKAMLKRQVFTQQQSTAAGVENAKSISTSLAISAEVAKVAKGEASVQYDYAVTLSTGPVQVFHSDDDAVGDTVLKNIGQNCQNVIRGHLRRNRLVFVAAKAIQAGNYDAVVERVPTVKIAAQCSEGFFSGPCRWWFGSPKAEAALRYSSKSRVSAPNQFVTIALVPAEIQSSSFESRVALTETDLGPVVASTARRSSFAYAGGSRVARSAAARHKQEQAAPVSDRIGIGAVSPADHRSGADLSSNTYLQNDLHAPRS